MSKLTFIGWYKIRKSRFSTQYVRNLPAYLILPRYSDTIIQSQQVHLCHSCIYLHFLSGVVLPLLAAEFAKAKGQETPLPGDILTRDQLTYSPSLTQFSSLPTFLLFLVPQAIFALEFF